MPDLLRGRRSWTEWLVAVVWAVTLSWSEHLMATTCQLFEEMMSTYHSLAIAGKEAGKSFNTQWAFRQLW